MSVCRVPSSDTRCQHSSPGPLVFGMLCPPLVWRRLSPHPCCWYQTSVHLPGRSCPHQCCTPLMLQCQDVLPPNFKEASSCPQLLTGPPAAPTPHLRVFVSRHPLESGWPQRLTQEVRGVTSMTGLQKAGCPLVLECPGGRRHRPTTHGELRPGTGLPTPWR